MIASGEKGYIFPVGFHFAWNEDTPEAKQPVDEAGTGSGSATGPTSSFLCLGFPIATTEDTSCGLKGRRE